jgi:hypothetical protein
VGQDTKFDKSAQDESKYIQLLVAWQVERTIGLHVRALLAEYNKKHNWDEDEQRRLHQKCCYSFNALVNPIRNNWPLDDTIVLATTIKAMNSGYRWDIFISEGIRDNVKRPLWIDTER